MNQPQSSGSHLAVEYIDPINLKPHPDNAKIHTDKQIDRVAKSMENTGGSVQPILVDENNVILAGHGRWMAHKKRGDVECPVIRKVGLTAAQKKKFLLADNQTNAMTGNDFEAVSSILLSLDSESIDISDIGFSEKEIDKFLNYEAEDEVRDRLEEASKDSFGAHELKEKILLSQDEYVGAYEMPRLRSDMLADIGDVELVVWMNRHRTPPLAKGQLHYHLFGRESTKGLVPDEAIFSFYIDDTRFERIWTKLKENTQRFVNAGVYAITMPDFTTVTNYPLPTNMWAMYRALYCARYWQEAGLYVIPNLMSWDVPSAEALSAAIPKNAPVVSCQLQTIDTGRKGRSSGARGNTPDAIREHLGVELELNRPQSLIVYAGERGLVLGREICERHNVKFLGVQNRADAAVGAFDEAD